MTRKKQEPREQPTAAKKGKKVPSTAAGKAPVAAPRKSTSPKGRKTANFPVVGIGASAGGLKALRELLKVLPADTGMAFVLIQHLNPHHESALPEIIGKATTMAVFQAEDGHALQPDTVVVIPPDFSLALEGRTLHLEKRVEPAGSFLPIDHFFISMAHELQDQAIAVVLSGSSSDGARGVIEVRYAGGLTLAQSEESAEYSSMPRQARLTDKVDFIGSAAEIGKLLGDIARHPHLYPDALPESRKSVKDDDRALEPIQSLLSKTGTDFSHYKQSTVRRRIFRRMALGRVQTMESYAARLIESPEELAALKEDLLIKVTSFFRDPEVFAALKKVVFPALFRDRDHDQPVRIWVPGCASGEEVYSLAIGLLEYLGDGSPGVMIQIFGTDLSEVAIEKARRGLYSETELEHLEPRRVERFFTKTDAGYQVNKWVRERCVFARQDFTRDPPFSRLDLISCRNVLIYLGPVLQKRVLPLFHYALRPGGFLLLGQSESIGQFDALFALVDPKARIYHKKSGSSRREQDFWPDQPLRNQTLKETARPTEKIAAGPDRESSMQFEVEQLLLRKYNPAAVVVDRDLQIHHFRGDTGPFLQPVPGKASLDLMKMIRDPLRMELRTLVHLANKVGNPQSRNDLAVRFPEGERLVRLEVVPFTIEERPYFLVEFHSRMAPETGGGEPGIQTTTGAVSDNELARLRQDLAASHAYQQTLIEDKERALEELRTANEEILSSNEELQSINEELETAKEELESSNEELTTVNQELQDRHEQLTRSHDDLNNLIHSAEIPFIIVNKDLTIRRISPTAGDYLNVRTSDIGRPLSDIKLRSDIPDLEAPLRQVIETGRPHEQELVDVEGRWRLLRLRPYRTNAERTEGAVLTLIDIDRLKQTMAELEQAHRFALGIVEVVKVPLLVLDDDFRVKSANPAFYQKFQVVPEQTEGKPIFDLGTGQWNNPDLKLLLEEILPKSRQMDDFLVKFDFPVLGERSMLVSARPMNGRRPRILLSIDDITPRLTLEQSLRKAKNRAEEASQAKSHFLANMSHEIRTPMTVVLGALEHLKEGKLNPDQSHCLSLAERASHSLVELIGDILDFSRIEARQLRLEQKPFKVRDCAEEAVGILRRAAEGKGLELVLKVGAGVPARVIGDQSRLRQVLTNLIGNAIKFTEEGSVEVKIFTQPGAKGDGRPRELFFSVSDTGCGIPESKLGLLFQSFSQVDPSITRRQGGSGLGLAICKGIVERMGGTIWVASEVDIGSTFTFTLPLNLDGRRVLRPQPASSPPPGSTLPAPSCRILLAEDDQSVQEVMRIVLQRERFAVEMVGDGEAALAAWERGGFDLILMDLQMGGMDGLTATRQIRAGEGPDEHIPIIALTAHALEETREVCLEAGMDDLLVKPLHLDDLRAMIARYCS